MVDGKTHFTCDVSWIELNYSKTKFSSRQIKLRYAPYDDIRM